MPRFQLVFSIPCRASRAKFFSPYSAAGISVVGYCRLACASTILRHYQRHRRRRRWHLLSGSGSGSSTAAIVGLGIISSPLPVSPLLCLLYHSPPPPLSLSLSCSLCLCYCCCCCCQGILLVCGKCLRNCNVDIRIFRSLVGYGGRWARPLSPAFISPVICASCAAWGQCKSTIQVHLLATS